MKDFPLKSLKMILN